MHKEVPKILYGGGNLTTRNRIQCIVKSTFSETRLVPALNDLLICNPSPAAVSRFRMGWLNPANVNDVGVSADSSANMTDDPMGNQNMENNNNMC